MLDFQAGPVNYGALGTETSCTSLRRAHIELENNLTHYLTRQHGRATVIKDCVTIVNGELFFGTQRQREREITFVAVFSNRQIVLSELPSWNVIETIDCPESAAGLPAIRGEKRSNRFLVSQYVCRRNALF